MSKFCPFRKITYYSDKRVEKENGVNIQYPPMTKEEFCPCLEDRCALFNDFWHGCSLKKR